MMQYHQPTNSPFPSFPKFLNPHSLFQPFHLVQMSPWPLTGSLSVMWMAFSLSLWFHTHSSYMLPLGLAMTLTTMACWWRDVIREATFWGMHTKKVQQGLEWGMILFITSEIMFFSAFFWSFFHSSLAPSLELGCSWPPTGISPLNPFAVPLLNTAVLLASGVSVTYAHHALLSYHNTGLIEGLLITVVLGAYFTYLQAMEYMETSFMLSDSVYGSTFFIATGFHGLHVIIGSSFLSVCLARAVLLQLSNSHHFGLEAAAWYWHFVDVVWIFLFIMMYWWASDTP